jgi:hypothetical protein
MTWIDGVAILVFALCAMGVWMWSLVTHPSFLREWLVWGLFTSAAMGVALYRIDVGLYKAFAGGLFFGFSITGMGLLRYHSSLSSIRRSEEENDRYRRHPPLDLNPSQRDD